jgi:hypothetical protein
MVKTITIKLKKAGSRISTFSISDDMGNVLATDVKKQQLIEGLTLYVEDSVNVIVITSTGTKCCGRSWTFPIQYFTMQDLVNIQFKYHNTASLWRHLTNPVMYNHYYGCINPYIIEYPFAYQYYDEILQNVKDYTKVYQYLPNEFGVFDDNRKIETDDYYFNKAVLYNGQQSSGILNLAPKPKRNLQEYMKYPIYHADSKTITFTKSDNFYQYNTFWSLVKNKAIPMFTTSCESMSIDKIVNQTNMDYSKRSFKKEPLRAKELKVRHILDNRSDIHLTSQFIYTPSQISYK